jgi:hypothetical protein
MNRIARVIATARFLALDWRVASSAFLLATFTALSSPATVYADGDCGPGREETTGCSCNNPPPGWYYCLCCTDSSGNPTCQWCIL